MRTTSILLFLCFTLGACQKAQPPRIPRGDPAAVEQVYADHALSYRGGFWGHKWQRADGSYNIADVAPSTDVYPESREVRKRARRRGAVVTVVAVIAGATLGFTAGNQMFAAEENQLSGSEAAGLYVTGGALLIGALLIEHAWVKPAYRDLATTYNGALRDDLSMR